MRRQNRILAAFLLMGLAGSTVRARAAEGGYMDHGVPAPVAESRGAIATADAKGNPIIIAVTLDQTLLLIAARTGETKTFTPPANLPVSANFCLMASSTGMFYVMMEETFLEFDPDKQEWTFAENAEYGTAMSLTEGPDGTIYAATYPRSLLVAFDPKTRKLVKLGQLDPVQQYPSFMTTDAAGWVYAGIGTARSNLAAFNPKTGERIQLAVEADRAIGTGTVFKGVDGSVYGRGHPDKTWLRLFEGKGVPVERPAAQAEEPSISWGRVYGAFPDGSRLTAFDMPNKTFEVTSRDGKKTQLSLDYKAKGAAITSLIAGPGGKIHGSTCHPFRLFSYDPKTGEMVDYGGLKAVGGGNWSGLGVLGDTVYGAAYARGILYAFDTTRPFADSGDDRANPRELARFHADIARPRAVLVHPNGRYVFFVGYPGYGRAGGGMCIYDLTAGKATLVENASILPGLSTVTLKALPNGDLVGGTSIHTPGGANPVAKAARLYLMDLETHKVLFDTEPVAGAPAIQCVEVDAQGKVYGITDTCQFFVFDTDKKEVIARADLAAYGSPLRANQSLITGPQGDIYLVMSKGIFRVDCQKNLPVKIGDLPTEAEAGLGIVADRLYFAAGSHVWSVPLPGP